MGYNDEYSGRVILDLETAPIGDAAVYIEPAAAPSNYKDQAKIDAYIREAQAEKLDKAALDPDLCRVVAVGLLTETSDPTVWLARDEAGEAAMLRLVWEAIGAHQVVGFNVLQFDVLVLLRRSLYLNVRAPRVQVDRFKHPQVIDLMQELSFNGTLKFHGLDFYCKRFGIPSDDTTTGAMTPGLVTAGDWPAIEAHVKADVLKTAALAERLGHFRRVAEVVL